MTPDEIQALREKHRKSEYGFCEFCATLAYDDGISCCVPYSSIDYPCDVIKVLDAYEALSKVSEEPLLQPDLIEGYVATSEKKCIRCGWVMGDPPLNCQNDNTPHKFPSQVEPECDHLMPDPITGIPTPANEWGHIFCPKCGKKL